MSNTNEKAEALKNWKRPDSALVRIANMHPLLLIVGALLILFSLTVLLAIAAKVEMPQGTHLIAKILFYGAPFYTLLYLLIATKNLKALLQILGNTLFKSTGENLSIDQYNPVKNTGDTVSLKSNNQPNSLLIKLIQKTTETDLTYREVNFDDYRGKRVNSLRSRKRQHVSYSKPQKITAVEYDSKSSSYEIQIPPLRDESTDEVRRDWLLEISVQKGIFSWKREVYLIPYEVSETTQ